MRTAVAAWRHARRQRRAMRVGQIFFQTLILGCKRSFFTPNASLVPLKTGAVPTDAHARHASIARAEQRYLGSKWVLVTIVLGLQMLKFAWHPHATHFCERSISHADVIGVRMGWVPLGRQTDSPFLVRWQRFFRE